KDWLTFVKTSRAQTKIRAYIRSQQREKSISLGRELLDREFKRFGVSLSKTLKADSFNKVLQDLGVRASNDLLSAVGYGKITPSQILQRVLPPERLAAPESPAPVARLTEMFKKVAGRSSNTGVRINGVDDVMVRFGRCCNPVPGDR